MSEKFDFNDILIVPAKTSKIGTRKSINPHHDGFLPLITAPMDTVINSSNEAIFHEKRIIPCQPRGETGFYGWKSFSLVDMKEKYNANVYGSGLGEFFKGGHYLIDIANGHMSELLDFTKTLKLAFPKVTLMVGNVANPETYVELSNAGADYVRIGIGNGGGCSTTVHTGIGFPMASLISECYEASLALDKPAKIVADGGMQTYSDIIKALALGADYVMIGNIFNKAIESCGDNYLWGKIKVPQRLAEFAYSRNIPVYKKFRGMSTKEVQKKWGKQTLTTSEGVIRFRKVEYTLAKWVENFEAYLRSAMSYSDALTLDEFIGQAKVVRITNNAYNRFNK